jgi:hypothetical protein
MEVHYDPIADAGDLECDYPVWFYDVNTDKLFMAQYSLQPVAAPSGPDANGNPAGIRADVFSCGDCDEGKRLVLLSKYETQEGDRDPTYFFRFVNGDWRLDRPDLALSMTRQLWSQNCEPNKQLISCLPN